MTLVTGCSTSVAARRRFPGLNGVRAFGALLVLTTHVGFESGAALNSSLNGVLSRMDVGVAIFFVISGFLLFRPHADAWLMEGYRPPTGRYLWHRALRILPALWIAIAGAALFLERPDEPLEDYLRHATLTQIYSPGHAAQGLTQMWSLATEAAFYLLLPALGWALTRMTPSVRHINAALGLLLLTPLAGAAWMAKTAALGSGMAAVWLPGYIGWFGLGMALALWRTARAARAEPSAVLDLAARHPGTVWGLAVALYLVAVSPVAGPYSLVPPTPGAAASKSIIYALLGALVVLPTVAARSTDEDPPAVQRMGGRTATFFGDISYGIFCYHLIVLGVIEGLLDYEIFTGGFFLLYVPTLAASVVVATVSFYVVERPLMRWGRRNERAPGNVSELTTARATATSTKS